MYAHRKLSSNASSTSFVLPCPLLSLDYEHIPYLHACDCTYPVWTKNTRKIWLKYAKESAKFRDMLA